MRIALVSEHANPLASLGGADAGGQNVHVAALAAGLAARGHRVTVHTRRDDPDQPERVVTDEGYAVEHVAAGPPQPIAKDDLLPHMPELGVRLRERWRREPVDVVHAHFWMSGLAALYATRGTSVPVVQTFHALGTVKQRHQGAADTSPPQRLAIERRLCRDVDAVIATCCDEVAELTALGLPRERAAVIPCGVDTDVFAPVGEVGTVLQPRRARARILSLGRLVPRKGVDTLVEALALLRAQEATGAVPETELVVAGGPPSPRLRVDPEVRRLQRLAEERGVADRVTWLGGVERDQVPALIRESDLVATVPWYEPFGIVPLEAMACGRPVVGSAVGGLLDTVVPGETGELVPPRDPEALAEALAGLLADPDRRATYGLAGRRRAVERYDWSQVVAETERVLTRVAGHEQVGLAAGAEVLS